MHRVQEELQETKGNKPIPVSLMGVASHDIQPIGSVRGSNQCRGLEGTLIGEQRHASATKTAIMWIPRWLPNSERSRNSDYDHVYPAMAASPTKHKIFDELEATTAISHERS
jgi:hypothetical protein